METTITFPMLGMALISDITAILRPGFLEITLKGLSTRAILSTLRIPKSTSYSTIEMMEMQTIVKSRMFQASLMQDPEPLTMYPYTIFLIISSIKNTALTTQSMFLRTYASYPFGFMSGVSRVNKIVENAIKNRITLSKFSCWTRFLQMILNQFSVENKARALPSSLMIFLVFF